MAALTATYLVSPKSLHRFVGYLEETAVETYADLVKHTRREGSQLHAAWSDVPASDLAKRYWQLADDAKWLDVLEQLLADESHHRDVNHTFADMDQMTKNPFVEKHLTDLERLFERAVVSNTTTSKKCGWRRSSSSSVPRACTDPLP